MRMKQYNKTKSPNMYNNYNKWGKGMMKKDGYNSTDDEETDGMLVLNGNSTKGMGKSMKKRENRTPGTHLMGMGMGMMMKSKGMVLDSDLSSPTNATKPKRMFRYGKNKTSTSKMWKDIIYAMQHTNLSVLENGHHNNHISNHTKHKNSTIGTMMQHLRKGLNMGFHHDRNNDTSDSNNRTEFSQNVDNGNKDEDNKFSRLRSFWSTLLMGFGDNINSTDGMGSINQTIIGTMMREWFHK
jgi:hypothetical protein